jgi:hypothetical protein
VASQDLTPGVGPGVIDFLSPGLAGREAVWRSSVERALADAPVEIHDISRTGKIEIRGDIDSLDADGVEVVRITPERALLLCPLEETARLRENLREQFLAIDVTGALAGLQVQGEQLMRRLTDLDLDNLPAVGPVARVQAYVLRDGESFRIFFPQEYGHYVGEVVVDAAKGLSAL